MRRTVLVVAMLLGACNDDAVSIAPDASVDAATDGTPIDAPVIVIGGSLGAPVGAPCNAAETYWCARYAGVCVASVCRAQCSGVDYPRCAPGTTEQHADLGRGLACYCAP